MHPQISRKVKSRNDLILLRPSQMLKMQSKPNSRSKKVKMDLKIPDKPPLAQ